MLIFISIVLSLVIGFVLGVESEKKFSNQIQADVQEAHDYIVAFEAKVKSELPAELARVKALLKKYV